MVPDDPSSTTDDPPASGPSPAGRPSADPAATDEASTGDPVEILLYGLVGGVAGSVLSFVPLATILGGVVAGYLQAGQPADGLKAGAVAGVVMALPFTAMVFFVLFLLGISGAPAEFGLLAIGLIVFGIVYTVGSGVLGGYLGNYLEREL